jgi:hypothetical protein
MCMYFIATFTFITYLYIFFSLSFRISAAVPLNVLNAPFALDESAKVGVCGDWFRADAGGE